MIIFGSLIAFVSCQRSSLESSTLTDEGQSVAEEKITYLEKVGEISEGFCDEDINYFARITSICVDREDNLYVADSGHHRIFKFDSDGKFISSFGRQGQGPGEFLGTIRISAGNDGKLYLIDDVNWNLYVFTSEGLFVNQSSIPRYLYDTPTVNSNGGIYLVSKRGLNVIDYFYSNMELEVSVLDFDYLLDFPCLKPSKRVLKNMIYNLTENEVKKVISKEDQLFVIFNNSQKVIQIQEEQGIINQFEIRHPRFFNDYHERLKRAKSQGGWISTFGSVFFDGNENICLCYYNAMIRLSEIYRYKKNALFIDTIRSYRIREATNQLIHTCDSKNKFYAVESFRIEIYRLDKIDHYKS
jgi:hypothetical protein